MKRIILFVLFYMLLLFVQNASANFLQYVYTTDYTSPSEANAIQNSDLRLGTAPYNNYTRFTGTAEGGNGSVSSQTTDLLSYLYAAQRINEKVAVGINITEPFYGHHQYGDASIVKFDTEQIVFRDVDISPQISYKLTPNLFIGIGFNANYVYDSQINFFQTNIGPTVNKATGWAYGWNIGLSYEIDPKDRFNVSYFSKLRPNLKGYSAGNGVLNTNFSVNDFYLPATFKLEYNRILNDQWDLLLKVYYAQWNTFRTIFLQNVVHTPTNTGFISLPIYYHNNWIFDFRAHYNITPAWRITGIVKFDQSPADLRSRTVASPVDNVYIAGLGLRHSFTKETNFEIIYTRSLVNTKIAHPLDNLPTFGDIGPRSNFVEFILTYKT